MWLSGDKAADLRPRSGEAPGDKGRVHGGRLGILERFGERPAQHAEIGDRADLNAPRRTAGLTVFAEKKVEGCPCVHTLVRPQNISAPRTA